VDLVVSAALVVVDLAVVAVAIVDLVVNVPAALAALVKAIKAEPVAVPN
jgi:hypothetical protein